jgi:hypothetical protein
MTGRKSSRAGLRRGLMIGCRVWETPDGRYRFIRPMQMDNGLQYRWLVHELEQDKEFPIYQCLDDDFATLAEARESVGV